MRAAPLTAHALLAATLLFAACGEKKAPEAAAAAAVEEAAPVAEAPAPEPEPEPPPPQVVDNVDLTITFARSDGSQQAGHVKRIERSSDWWGEADWLTDAAKTTLTLEGGGTEIEVGWDQIKQITVASGNLANTDTSWNITGGLIQKVELKESDIFCTAGRTLYVPVR